MSAPILLLDMLGGGAEPEPDDPPVPVTSPFVAAIMRTFGTLAAWSASKKYVAVQALFRKEVMGWNVSSSGVWVAPFSATHGGIQRDVLRVQVGSRLFDRVERLADVADGKFFYDIDETFDQDATWDDGTTQWDDGVTKWDQFPKLYVGQTTNPEDDTVVAELGFFYANTTLNEATLGLDKLTDGGLETWSDASTLTNWTKTLTGTGAALARESTQIIKGTFSARLTNGTTNDGQAQVVQAVSTHVSGKRYRITGYYRTEPGLHPEAMPYLRLKNSSGLYLRVIEGTNRGWGWSSLLAGGSFAAHYEFQSDGSDEVASTDLTEVNTPTYGAAVKGNGAQLTRVTTIFDSPNFSSTDSGFDVGTDSFVFAIKVKPDNLAASWESIAAKNVSLARKGWKLYAAGNGRVGFQLKDATTHYGVFSSERLADATWGSIVFSVDQGAKIFEGFINGSLDATNDISAMGDIDFGTFYIGRAGDSDTNAWDGRVDQAVFVAGRRWSAAEALEYHAAAAGDPPGAWVDGAIKLPHTAGEWRKFSFDFEADDTTITHEVGVVGLGAGTPNVAGYAYFDGVAVQRIYRDNLYEPRIAADVFPQASGGTAEPWFGPKQTSVTTLSLLNQDAHFDEPYGDLDVVNSEVRMLSGGELPNGERLTIDEYAPAQVGIVRNSECSDEHLQLGMEDLRATFHIDLPKRSYSRLATPQVDENDVGRPRPLLFGQKTNIRAIVISTDDDDLPTYELCDTNDVPNGIKAVDAVHAYADEEAANKRDTSRRVTVNTADYTADLGAGSVAMDRLARVFEVTTENNLLDFDVGGSEFTAEIPTGVYNVGATGSHGLCETLEDLMNTAASVADITVDYSNSTKKVTIAKGAGTLNLRISNGSNKESGPWTLLGYDRGANKTGALSYEGDKELYADFRRDFVLRFDAQGIKDDASGTYTGTANALLTLGSDIIRLVVVALIGRDSSSIDETSFVAARSTRPQTLGQFLNAVTTTQDVFLAVERSTDSDIFLHTDGKVYYEPRSSTVPSTAPHVRDNHFTSFKLLKDAVDVYARTRIAFDENPATANRETREAETPSTIVRFRRPETIELRTWNTNAAEAQALAATYAARAAAPRAQIEAVVRGVLVDTKFADRVKVTRSRAAVSDGSLSEAEYRVLRYTHDYHAMESTVLLLENTL